MNEDFVRIRAVEGGILVEPSADKMHDEKYNSPLHEITANDNVSKERKK